MPRKPLSEANKARMQNLVRLHTTHGLCKSKTYACWSDMKRRCYKVSFKQYHNYGGKGITVCDRWLNSFENFLADMGDMPPKHTIDRIDNSAGYSPTNCRWATKKEQAQNRSTTILYEGKTFAEWEKILNIKARTLITRFYRNWPKERVLSSNLDNRGVRHA